MRGSDLSRILLDTSSGNKWLAKGTHRRAGVLIPLFSVYSKKSFGAGDFADLKLVADWAEKSANSIIQLLPLNAMNHLLCPYDSLSSFALEPAYLSLRDTGVKNKKFPPPNKYLDYSFRKEKLALAEEAYRLQADQEPEDLLEFQWQNAYWLPDFALYAALKNYHQGKPWYEWENEFKNRDKKALDNFQKAHAQEISFQVWLQWQLYLQLTAAKKYAAARKILLKGDLPILVSRDSADVWQHPEFFKLDFASGAPPDMYCAKGQRWGMPTYNWERIKADGFRYLKEKLKYAGNFYDILRIDHVVGLFRIWSIPYQEPLENMGLNGFFDPQDESKWAGQGRELLSVMLKNTDMLLCAEDLGVIPQVCTDTLKELGIPGNDVERWAKDWKVRHDFLEPQDYRGISVAMLSTHDTTNWPAWWENEAGTVDEGLFLRKCNDHRQIDFLAVRERLFDLKRSRHGRLRWRDDLDSVDKLVQGLSPKGTVPKEHLADFIDLYQNSFQEKEKLWKHLKISGPMREKCDSEILRQALKISLDSNAIFCVNTIVDWFYLADIFSGDPYPYRINTPGTINDKNWSLVLPLSLEELLKHKVAAEIRTLISASNR